MGTLGRSSRKRKQTVEGGNEEGQQGDNHGREGGNKEHLLFLGYTSGLSSEGDNAATRDVVVRCVGGDDLSITFPTLCANRLNP